MNPALLAAALLLALLSLAHSYLGERYLLMRLFRRGNLPRILGSESFSRNTLRYAWHATSVTWIALAGLLVLLAGPEPEPRVLLVLLAGTFLLIGAVALVASKGKHLSWPVFLALAVLCWVA